MYSDQEQLELLRNWLNTTDECIFIKDLNYVYRAVSKGHAKLMKTGDMNDIVGKDDYELYPKELADKFVAEDKIILETKKPKYYKVEMNHPEKGKITTETIKYPIFDKEGNIVGMQGISKDITQFEEVAQKVTSQSSQLEAIFENIPVALWLKDANGKYITVNRIYEDFYNVKQDNLIAHDVRKTLLDNHLATEETVDKLIETDFEIMNTGKVICKTFPMIIHGENRMVEITKAPIFGKDNKVVGLLGISTDITEKLAYQNLLEKSKEIAESANKAKSEFLANMSHEIRTPMNGILGFVQLLSGTNLDEEQRDYVQEVQKSSEILLKLLNDILDLSKIEAGKMVMEDVDFNLRHVLEDVGTLASSNASAKAVEINVLCYSDIPEKIVGDSGRLKQVLNNFVNNAIKFTDEGEINLTARLLDKFDDKVKLEFSIEDTGIGISKENQDKIFESFIQADSSTTRKYGGTGLGLAISKNFIHMMNGEITLKSELGKGSSFVFTAEFKVSDATENQTNKNLDELKDMKVLVLDDNQTNLKVISYYLRDCDFDITSVSSATEALELMENAEDKYDLILTDYCMPIIDGVEFSKRAKNIEKYKNVPIIMLSSRAQLGECKKDTSTVINGYLPKPVRKNDLLDCIALVMCKTTNTVVTEVTINEAYRNLKMKVLLVEDNPINQKLTSKMLLKAGLNCDIANNGQEAVDAIKSKKYDLVLMDCQMPILDGYAATEKIRNELKQKNLPIIALTANVMDSDSKKCLDAGMDDYLAKPLNYEKLMDKIKKYSPNKLQINEPENDEINDEINHEELYKDTDTIIKLIVEEFGFDEATSKELVSDFLNDLKTQLVELKSAVAEKKYEEVDTIAHSIKGAAGNLRINKIYEAAKTVEFMGKEKDVSQAEPFIEKIEKLAKSIKL